MKSKQPSRLQTFRDAKLAGISAEQVFAIVKQNADAWRGLHAPAERAMALADAIERIEKVYGKRAAKRIVAALDREGQ